MPRAWILTFAFVFVCPFSFAAVPNRALTLDDLYSMGSSQNENVLQAKERWEQAQEVMSQTKGAFLPTINLLGSYQRIDVGNVSSSLASFAPNSQTNVRFTGRQLLFQGGAEYFGYSRNSKLESAAEQDYAFTKQNYYLSLAQVYFDALRVQSQLRYAENDTKIFQNQVQELKKRVSIGRTRQSELLSSQSALAASTARKKTLESELAALRTNLKTLSKIEGEPQLKEELPFSAELAGLDEYLRDAENRPDLKSAQLRRDAASRDLWINRAGHMPTLDLSGNYWLKRGGFNNTSKWDATLTLTVPIFQGGIIQSQVRRSASLYREAEVNTSRIQLELRDEITNLYTTLKNAIDEMKARESAVELAEKAYDQVNRDFRYGLTTHLDTLQSLRNLQEARLQLDDARYRRYAERVRLEVRCGRLPKN